ncbi:ABC transporter [Bradyrhizobium sp. IC3069]|uniref:ABC transporter substrate-binding protein n=1 Tax=unclassified Bradyrhizobium TaxID=2631580 RepID=UPI001CD5BFBF|nr:MULTISPECIES: ABC transporter substrate-binding protein [unclassified Bradyrhizobium]MCA1365371.1 ABC transporter [Bradyrhizobium sp. IC4059]MCA1522868.1 ABC transporter [Bradyrhizobium sp. IC3069]
MIGRLLSEKPNLILTITTPVSQGAKAILQNTDAVGVFAAVSDPVQASLVQSWQGGDKNMTGASDLQDIDAVLNFTHELLPDAKWLGVPYNPGEDNDVAVLRIIKDLAPRYGFKVVEIGVETVNDIPVRISAFKGRADVLYVMTSNLLQSSEPAVAAAAQSVAIPVISANDANVRTDSFLASFAVDYASVGRLAADLAARILKGEKPENIPVAKPAPKDHKPVISARQMEKFGLKLPASLSSCNCMVD